MPIAPPTWFSTIGVAGNARASSASSPSCVKYIQASKLSPSGCSFAKPSRTLGSFSSPAARLTDEPRAASLGCEAVI